MKTTVIFLAMVATACALDEGGDLELATSAEQSELGLGGGHANPRALAARGRRLYDQETFAGNGRSCLTCHGFASGTVSPAEAQQLFADDPDAPLFRSIDSDDGVGESYDRLLTHATVRVGLPLPVNVHLAEDPAADSVVFLRGIPTTINTPALDPVLMYDGRAPDLEFQAFDAILGHAQAGRIPDELELDAIAAFERQNPRFFSSPALRDYASGGPAPTLPPGNTASEQRGREFFVAGGRCAGCHGGPMLDATGSGRRFLSAGVSELNRMNNPVYTFVFTDPDSATVEVVSPDLGRAMITGDPRDADRFKISSLWGVKRTAPYFHDNSAATLEDVTSHYDEFFRSRGDEGLTAQEQTDIAAYMRLL